MAIDYSKMVQQAKVSVEKAESFDDFGSTPQYKVKYVPNGELKVRILQNVKTGLVKRQILRHKIDQGNGQSKQVNCLRNYGSKCPICDIVDTMKSLEIFQARYLKAPTRGICYAQFISATDPEFLKGYKDQDGIKPGEVFILMFPWSVGRDMDNWINDFGGDVNALKDTFESFEGYPLIIKKTVDGKNVSYNARVSVVSKYKSAESDEKFAELLESIPSLATTFLPQEISDDIIKEANLVAEMLKKQFVDPRSQMDAIPQVNTTTAVKMETPSSDQLPFKCATESTTSGTVAEDKDDVPCFGDYLERSKSPEDINFKMCKLACDPAVKTRCMKKCGMTEEQIVIALEAEKNG